MTEKPKIRLMHTQEPDRYGRIFSIVRLYRNDPSVSEIFKERDEFVSRHSILLGAPRLKLKFKVLKHRTGGDLSKVYAVINRKSFFDIQTRFFFLDKKCRNVNGYVKVPAVCIAQERRK